MAFCIVDTLFLFFPFPGMLLEIEIMKEGIAFTMQDRHMDTQSLLLREAHSLIDNLSFTKAKQMYQALLDQNVSTYHQKDVQFKKELEILYYKLSLYGNTCSASILFATQNYTELYSKMQEIEEQYSILTVHSQGTSKLLEHVHQEYTSYSHFLLHQLGFTPNS